MTSALYRIGKFCARHHWIVMAVWLVIVVALASWVKSSGGMIASNSVTLPNTPSQNATDVLTAKLPELLKPNSPIVVHSADKGLLTSPQNSAAIASAVAVAKASPEVESVVSPLPPSKTSMAAGALLSADKKTALIQVTLTPKFAIPTADEANNIVNRIEKPLTAAGLENAAGGGLGATAVDPNASYLSFGIGIAAALIVLLLTFGSVVTMLLPIITAIFGVVIGTMAITLISHVSSVPSSVGALGGMIGLGVGIDYSLFVLSRHREQLSGGMEISESIGRSVATSGAAVLFAGTTVVIALCSLAIAGIPIVAQLGYLSAIFVITAILSALTLLPAVLGLLGKRYDALRVPGLHKRTSRAIDHDTSAWAKWARGIARHPWPPLVAAVVILLVIAIPTKDMIFGQIDTAAGSKQSQATHAYDLNSAGFGQGSNGPILVVVKLNGNSGDAAAIKQLEQAIAADPDVLAPPAPPLYSNDKSAAVITVVPKSAPPSDATQALVDRLRVLAPKELASTGQVAYVGGQTAAFIDIADEIQQKLPVSILIVVALSFLLLLVAFRSVLVPLQAAFMNLLGVAAAYGMLVAVFQWGWGIGLIGLSGSVPIVSFVPLMMFAILFGLSMDYEVFLVTHIQEEYEESGDNETAVIRGLSRSARVITSAALIMVCVFLGFVTDPDPTTKQFGLGLAFAVAIDATIVRCVLVPALMVIVGKRNWWLPNWLAKILPKGSIEGTGFFKKLDAKEKTAAPQG
ncbi:MAG: MMPL family transporter [Actinomycetes bacterium]